MPIPALRPALALLSVLLLTSLPGASCSGGFGGGSPCPSVFFVVPDFGGDPNPGYPDPELSADCASGSVVVESNAIPGFEFQQITPNDLQAQSWTFTFPRFPQMAAQTSEIPLLGTIGVSTDGMPLFGPNEAGQPAQQAFGDPIYNGIVDFCLGHTAMNGVYHYHAMLVECITGLAADDAVIIGYALDGFEIWGPTGCVDSECTQTQEHLSSYELLPGENPTTQAWDAYGYMAQTGSEYLDECNGHVGPDGDYHYHATTDFPYILGCYRGEPTGTAVNP